MSVGAADSQITGTSHSYIRTCNGYVRRVHNCRAAYAGKREMHDLLFYFCGEGMDATAYGEVFLGPYSANQIVLSLSPGIVKLL